MTSPQASRAAALARLMVAISSGTGPRRTLFSAVCTLVMLAAFGAAFLVLTGQHPLPSQR